MKAYLNDKEIPIEDCFNDQGNIINPEYMKEGDIFRIESDWIEMENPRCEDITIIPSYNETIH